MNRNCRIAIAVLLIVSFGGSVHAQAPESKSEPPQKFDFPKNLPRILSTLQTHLDQLRATARFPGAQVGFTWVDSEASDKQPHSYSSSVASGLSDVDHNAPMKTADRLLAGSTGKTFVAAVAMLLVEQGKLSLDDKISTWLGNESWFSHLPNGPGITLRMLLNHSSGIRDHVDVPAFEKALRQSAARDIDYSELIAYVLNSKPLFPPGQGYSYADTNYILAGMIIEKASGKSLYALIGELILRPLKLERTIPSNAVVLKDVANGYMKGKPVMVNGRFTINPQWEWAGGGFASTAEDLSRWGAMLYGGNILKRESLDQMFKSTTTGDGANYGLGVMMTTSHWGTAYGHDGDFPGYLSVMRYYPKSHLSIALMVNSDDERIAQFVAPAVNDFAGDIFKVLIGREISSQQQVILKQLATSWLNLIDAGQYAESWKLLGSKLKAKYTDATWGKALHPLLSQTGKIKKRIFRSATYQDSQGETVAIEFDSSFTNAAAHKEVVTLILEEGQWRITGYSIH